MLADTDPDDRRSLERPRAGGPARVHRKRDCQRPEDCGQRNERFHQQPQRLAAAAADQASQDGVEPAER